METYILEFMKRNDLLRKYKFGIQNCTLAFLLLDIAGLEGKEKQIALTAVSFSKPDEMCHSMQQPRKEFLGSEKVLSLGVEY